MMGIYVNDIELPKEPDEMIELAIFGDGRTVKTGESWRSPVDGKCYYGPSEDMNTYSAFAVPPHGDLIDYDFCMQNYELLHDDDGNPVYAVRMREINSAPTVIPAEPPKEET